MVTPSDSKPKIVIAGGTGYLGQLIAESFHQDNWDVVLFPGHLIQATKLDALFTGMPNPLAIGQRNWRMPKYCLT